MTGAPRLLAYPRVQFYDPYYSEFTSVLLECIRSLLCDHRQFQLKSVVK